MGEPHHYVLSLVSGLVGLGARCVRIRSGSQRVELSAEGLLLEDELLHHPLQALFHSDSNPAARELAAGIHAALAYPKGKVRLWNGAGLLGEFETGGFQVHQKESPQVGSTRLEIDRRGDPACEVDELRRCFSFCPTPLWSGDQLLTSSLPGKRGSWSLELVSSQELPSGQQLALPPTPVWRRRQHPARLHALVQLGPVSNACHWVVMGRSYRKPLPWKQPPSGLGVHLWACCDTLDKDLSLACLVDNERYQRIGDYLRSQILSALDEALEDFLREPQSWDAEELQRFAPVATYALECSARAGQKDWALALQQALLKHPACEPATQAAGRFRLSLLSRGLQAELASPPRSNLEELWDSARAALAIRGLSYPMTGQLLWECSEMAAQQSRWEVVMASLEPLANQNAGPQVRLRLGEALLQLERFSEAREQLVRGVSASELEDRGSERLLRARELLAQCLARLGDPREAARQLAEVLRVRREFWGDTSTRLGPLLVKLTALCRALGEEETARHYERWAQQLDSD